MSLKKITSEQKHTHTHTHKRKPKKKKKKKSILDKLPSKSKENEKKKKKVRRKATWVKVQLYMGIFVQGENTWVSQFIFLPHSTKHSKKVFLLIFSSKFSIHYISPPNKHTLKL